MVVGILKVILHFPYLDSLKGKRRILNSLKQNLKHKYNISISEVDDKDLWQKSLMGISMIGESKKFIERNFSRIIDHCGRLKDGYLVRYHSEFLHLAGEE
ncbi:MAG: DUF503 domain-containing protein [bacterium]|nr:DUF503 domain-containing protein [bacterium]